MCSALWREVVGSSSLVVCGPPLAIHTRTVHFGEKLLAVQALWSAIRSLRSVDSVLVGFVSVCFGLGGMDDSDGLDGVARMVWLLGGSRSR